MAREGGNEKCINVVPNQDQPYFARKRVKVPESVGLAAITLDFNLTRRTWITGAHTDKATGDRSDRTSFICPE